MAWSDVQGLLSSLMSPSLPTIIITALIALAIPILLHFTIYLSSSATHLPTILLIGPRSSGKTSLLTLLERGTNPAATHTSQTPLTIELSLPIPTPPSSSHYRSTADPAHQVHKRFLLVDTPGHGKLRHHALDSLVQPSHLKGIIFLVDAADLAAADAGLREAAEYLHDVLLLLQKRATTTAGAGRKAVAEVPVLVAANKLDLFTALPARLVRGVLEGEITAVRRSRAKGLLDSGIGMGDGGDVGGGGERDWLGDGGEGRFDFSQMEEVNVSVTVVGGSVAGAEGADVAKWWDWIGCQL